MTTDRRRTRLIAKTRQQVEAEASALVEAARKYPRGTLRRRDLYNEALGLVVEWRSDQAEGRPKADQEDGG